MSAEPLPEAFAKAVDLFTCELKLLGHEDLRAYPGIFSVQVDDLWEIATHAQAGPIDRCRRTPSESGSMAGQPGSWTPAAES